MQTTKPEATLDPRFSSEDATPTEWSAARAQLRDAKSYQLTTVRAGGRPHQSAGPASPRSARDALSRS